MPHHIGPMPNPLSGHRRFASAVATSPGTISQGLVSETGISLSLKHHAEPRTRELATQVIMRRERAPPAQRIVTQYEAALETQTSTSPEDPAF